MPSTSDNSLSTNMMNLIPGFSIIKNKVITPLLVATERVVDFILPEGQKNLSSECSQTTVKDSTNDSMSDGKSTVETKSLPECFRNLTLTH